LREAGILVRVAVCFSIRFLVVLATSLGAPAQQTERSPSADEILEKYVQALGGRSAVERLTSRTARGTMKVSPNGASGSIETYEKAPNKVLTEITSPHRGIIRTGFNGTVAWEQRGGNVTEPAAYPRREADFYFAIKLRELYPGIAITGRSVAGGHEAWILEAPRGGNPKRWYFDAATGLLIRTEVADLQGSLLRREEYDDFRVVDGIRIPFATRGTQAGEDFVIHLTEVRHNLPIDDAKFDKPSVNSASLSSAEQAASSRLRIETIREVTTVLASNEMQGRGIAQPGGDKAAEYLPGRSDSPKPVYARAVTALPISSMSLCGFIRFFLRPRFGPGHGASRSNAISSCYHGEPWNRPMCLATWFS
jgi:hypothetical protein